MPNRKFGSPRLFGTSTTFGASSDVGRQLSIGLMVDWDNDGYFDGANEAVGRLASYSFTRGREFFLNSNGDGFQPVSVGRLTAVLKDLDGRYNPYNASSPLFGQLSGNQRIKLIVCDETTGTIYNRFFGHIQDIKYDATGGVPIATITAQDGIFKLQDNPVRTSSVKTSLQYEEAIRQVLEMAKWSDGTNIDTVMSDTLTYWWTRGRAAFTELQELVDATFGLFFVAADGRATYLSRLSSATPAVSIVDDDVNYEYGVRVPSPREVVRNLVKVYARARKANNSVEIWRAVDVPSFSAGQTKALWANFSYNGQDCPATAVTAPVATTDYTGNTLADGTGTNKTADFSIVMTQFASSAKLSVTYNGTGTAYLTLCKLRGSVITADEYTYAEDDNTDSQASYGLRELSIKSDWLQDINTAIQQAYTLVTQLSNPSQFPRVLLRNKPAKQFAVELFDLVSVDILTYGVSDELRVGYISESWSIDSPNTADTIFYFEPNLAGTTSGSWIFPAIFGLTTVFA